tara:strand:- start:75 stop:1256 length:1182 start_codon:yes stop_codon:yes gene_type:complete
MTDKYEGITIKNSSSANSKEMFEIRQTYDSVFPSTVESYDFIDKKNIMYGRLNIDNDTVHVNEFYLKEISSTKSNNILCLNFVGHAFRDFREAFKNEYGKTIKKDQFFSTDWDAKKSFENPHIFYDRRMKDITDVFIKQNLFAKNNKDLVKNIDDFMRILFDDFYPSMGSKMPITKSGLIASKYYNPATTGLCIEISSDDAGLDYVKFNKFIKSPNFEFYLLLAAEYGFFVDKNTPWRLVANLNSSKMQEYMAKYNLSKGTVFDTCFVKTYKYDIQNLKAYIWQMYESFLAISPNYMESVPVFGTLKCPPDKQANKKAVPREKITYDSFQSKYDNLTWLKIYYRIKLDEIGVNQSNALTTKELQKIEQIYNSLDFEGALDYVNDRVKLQMNWE